jgi:hypothetical protein
MGSGDPRGIGRAALSQQGKPAQKANLAGFAQPLKFLGQKSCGPAGKLIAVKETRRREAEASAP